MKAKRYRYGNRYIVISYNVVTQITTATIETFTAMALHRVIADTSEAALTRAKQWIDAQREITNE